MKKEYEKPEMEIVEFETEDIAFMGITSSGITQYWADYDTY